MVLVLQRASHLAVKCQEQGLPYLKRVSIVHTSSIDLQKVCLTTILCIAPLGILLHNASKCALANFTRLCATSRPTIAYYNKLISIPLLESINEQHRLCHVSRPFSTDYGTAIVFRLAEKFCNPDYCQFGHFVFQQPAGGRRYWCRKSKPHGKK